MPFNTNTGEFEMNSVEKKFDEAVNAAEPLIYAKVEAAQALLKEAAEIAEQHGVPFNATLCSIHHTYIPSSFKKKFKGLDDLEHWDVYLQDGYPGWTNSYNY
jgi:collagenase-like PrtC family protease